MTLTPQSRRGNATPMVALVILFLLAAILGIALVLYDGAEGTAEEARNPPVGSVEGNLAAHAIGKSLVIKQFLNDKSCQIQTGDVGIGDKGSKWGHHIINIKIFCLAKGI